MGAADSRDQLHGEARQAMFGIRLGLFFVKQRVKQPNQNSIRLHHRQLVRLAISAAAGSADLEDHLGRRIDLGSIGDNDGTRLAQQII